MEDKIVVTTEALPKREPIIVNRDVWYSFLSKEDADPQACWLERKRQEKMKAAKAILMDSSSPTSSSGFVVLDASELGNVQQKVVNQHQNQTGEPSAQRSNASLEEALRKHQEFKAAKAAQMVSASPTSSTGSVVLDSLKFGNAQQKVNRNQNKTPSPPSSVSSVEDGITTRKLSPKAGDAPSGIKVIPHQSPSPQNSVHMEVTRNVPSSCQSDCPNGIDDQQGGHFASIGQYLHEVFKREQICDISFAVGNVIYPAHKVVLSSQSSFFEKLFNSKEFTQPPLRPHEIRVNGVSDSALKIFLNCIYTGNMQLIKSESLPEILQLSQVFEVEQITRMCYQQMSSLCIEDLLHLLPKMKKVGDIQVCDIIIDVITKKFLDIRNCPSFFELDLQSLCLILLNDGLNVNSEVEVFDTAVSWLHHHNVEERLKHLDQVMDTIRFSLLSHKDLMACFRKCPALKQSPHCVGLITMANWVQTSIDLNQQDPLNLEAPKHRNAEIIGQSVKQYLSTHCSSDIKAPDVSFDIIPMTEDSLKDFNLHACLGSQSWSTVSAAHVQQYRESKYTSISNSVPFKNIAMTGQLLGPDVSDIIRNQENLARSHQQNQQQIFGPSRKDKGQMILHAKKKERDKSLMQDANNGQSNSREAMVWDGEFWYMVGGARYKDSKRVHPTKRCMVYSYQSNEWKSVAPMNVARMKHSLCVADGLLYAIGGIGKGNRILTSVECFNPRTNCWFFVKALPEPRAGGSASAEGANVCLKGGYAELNGQPSLYNPDQTIVYNVESNKWTRKY